MGAIPIVCDVTDDASMDAAFAAIDKALGKLDFLVHAIAMADRTQLMGSFVENTTREGFRFAMDISAYSFVDASRRAAKLMPDGGAIMTLTYLGAERPMPNYNMMGVAKAALESAVRYIARDLGPQKIRVNAISAGAIRTLSLAGIQGGRQMHAKSAAAERAQGAHGDRECRRHGALARLRPRPLLHRRSGARRRRHPHDGPAGRAALRHLGGRRRLRDDTELYDAAAARITRA